MALFKNFLNNKSGNVAAIFTVSLFPILATIGSAVDYSMYVNKRAKVAQAVDAAILAASVSVNNTEELSDLLLVNKKIEQEFDRFLQANLEAHEHVEYKFNGISYDPLTQRVEAKVSFNYDTHFMGIFGKKQIKQNIVAATKLQTEESGALSMYLVLDKSGSMGWQGKMVALKTAIASMSMMFEEMDPEHKYVRTGAVAYDWYTHAPVDLNWGSVPVSAYTQTLGAYGGTNSSKAVKIARKALRSKTELKEHEAKNGQEPSKVMVFMTDGANNSTQHDKQTKKYCDKAKKDSIEIYTVAFMAPIRGQDLLKYCANSAAHYYDASDTQELIEAFREIATSATEDLVLIK